MRISQLARAAGVPPQTIHYYLRAGLLPPPTKTAPNMAYYGPEYVEEIRLIKELQETRYLPLSVIKLLLEAKRQGKDISQLDGMRVGLEEVFRPLGPEEELEPVAVAELVAVSGLPTSTIEELEEAGLLSPTGSSSDKRYDGFDVRIARSVKTLLDLGLAPSDLAFYRQYVDVLLTEARVVGGAFRQRLTIGRPTDGAGLMRTLDDIKAAIAAKVYGQAAVDFGSPNRHPERDDQ